VLDEGEFYRVGGQQAIQVDVRIIAATNQDLDKAVAIGNFREDLYHRLNVMRINTPPLRERREDIPSLLTHYLLKSSKELGIEAKILTPAAQDRLQGFGWPGNIRQLINATRRMMVNAPGNEIRADDIPTEFGGQPMASAGTSEWTAALAQWATAQLQNGMDVPLLKKAQPDFERALILAALQKARGRKQQAAKLLGWGRNTLTRKIKELGIGA